MHFLKNSLMKVSVSKLIAENFMKRCNVSNQIKTFTKFRKFYNNLVFIYCQQILIWMMQEFARYK